MAERNPNAGRILENVLYGTPVYPGSTTPDGRIVGEIHRGRLATDRQQEQVTALQRQTVDALRQLHGGKSVVSREAYLATESQTQGILRDAASQMAGIQFGQRELLDEARLLNDVAVQGFGYVGHALGEVREGVHEVATAVESGTRTLHGPSLPTEGIETFMGRRRVFFEILGAQQKGLLSPTAERDLRDWTDTRFGSAEAGAAVEGFLQAGMGEGHDALIQEIRRRSGVLMHPSELLMPDAAVARENLTVMERVAEHLPNDTFRTAVQNARALARLGEEARRSGISEEFLIDLTNNGLVSDGTQHEVKRRHREARRPGAGVDRAYHLMELLNQGDHARWQRDQGLQQGRHLARLAQAQWLAQAALVEQGGEAHGQRETLIYLADEQTVGIGELVELGEQGVAQRRVLTGIASAHLAADIGIGRETHRRLGALEEVGREGNTYLETVAGNTAALIEEGRVGNWHLGRISDSLVGANTHLVNLEALGERFIETMGEGFEEVATILRDGFAMEEAALAELTFEIALTRAEVVGRLESLEETVRAVGLDIQREIARTNALLAELIDLTAHPLRTRARERVQQGLATLRRARSEKNVATARRLFEAAVEDDTTVMEGHYGVAATAELAGDYDAAGEHYGLVGTESPAELSRLAVAGWQGYAKVQEERGDLPAGIKGLRNALEREGETPTSATLWMLARALALSGLNEEATEILLALVNEEPDYLYQPRREAAFDAFPLGNFYRQVLTVQIRDVGIRIYLVREFLRLGEEEEAMKIIHVFFEYNPGALLHSGMLESILIQGVRDTLETYVEALAQQERPFSAEAWYAIAFIALRLNLAAAKIFEIFKKGLAEDMDFYSNEGRGIAERLRGIDAAQFKRLREIAISCDPNLNWIEN